MSIRERVRFRESIGRWLRMGGQAFNATVHERLEPIQHRLDALEQRLDALQHRLDVIEYQHRSSRIVETQKALLEASIHIVENLHALAGRTVIEKGAAIESPEAAMAAFLYSHVPHRTAIEIGGANSLELAGAGYEVTVAAPKCGCGKAGPVGFLAAGSDARAVIGEIGDFSACVIAADLSTNQPGNFEELAAEMRRRAYHWHVALYRSPKREGASYFANFPRGVPDAEGSVFFFRDYGVFAEAQAWCAATLPRTYFKPPQD